MSEIEAELPPPKRRRFRLALKSQLIALLVVYLLVPLGVGYELHNADEAKRALLLASVQRQGVLIGQALQPVFAQPGLAPITALGPELARFATTDSQVRVLLAPVSGAAAGSFYYVAAAPESSAGTLDAEREMLSRVGVLDRLSGTCSGGIPYALRYRSPDGREDVMTSGIPFLGPAGCWLVVVTHNVAGSTGALLGRSFVESREIKVAIALYLLMFLVSFWVFVRAWRALKLFAKQAQDIAAHGPRAASFEARNPVPELSNVARDVDRMVERLKSSAAAIRRTAEDNLHAFKTPIAVIRQSIEPFMRPGNLNIERSRRAMGLIESSLDRLDALVVQTKRLDEATADLIDAPLGDLDVSLTLERLLSGYDELIRQRGLILETRLERGVIAHASADLFETAIENILDNAIDFSPKGCRISVGLARRANRAEVTVSDEGPGIDPADKARIFERYYSTRSVAGERAEEAHFGLGLSIVRRNVEVMGGTVGVENGAPRGLRVAIRLPLAQAA